MRTLTLIALLLCSACAAADPGDDWNDAPVQVYIDPTPERGYHWDRLYRLVPPPICRTASLSGLFYREISQSQMNRLFAHGGHNGQSSRQLGFTDGFNIYIRAGLDADWKREMLAHEACHIEQAIVHPETRGAFHP